MGTKIVTTNVYSCKPEFYYIKVGFMSKGVKIICFRDEIETLPYLSYHLNDHFTTY